MATGLQLWCFPAAVVKSSTSVIHPKQIVEMTRIFRVDMSLTIARAAIYAIAIAGVNNPNTRVSVTDHEQHGQCDGVGDGPSSKMLSPV